MTETQEINYQEPNEYESLREDLRGYLYEQVMFYYQNDTEKLEAFEKHVGDIANAVMDPLIDLSAQFQIPLKPPFDLLFTPLPRGISAQTDGKSITLNMNEFVDYALKMDKKTNYYRARIKSLIAHEFYHLNQKKQFPKVLERNQDLINSSDWNITKYHLSNVEQSAELFSIRYLLSLHDGNEQANLKVARELKETLRRNLIRHRLKEKLGKLFTNLFLAESKEEADRIFKQTSPKSQTLP